MRILIVLGVEVHTIMIIVLSLAGIYLFDKFCLWAERKGYLFYRQKKSEGSAIGSALLELQGFLNPAARHTIEMRQNVVKHKRSEADVPGQPKD